MGQITCYIKWTWTKITAYEFNMLHVYCFTEKWMFVILKLRIRNLKEATSPIRLNFMHNVPRITEILVLSLFTQHTVSPWENQLLNGTYGSWRKISEKETHLWRTVCRRNTQATLWNLTFTQIASSTSVLTPQKMLAVFITKTNCTALFRAIIAVYWKNHNT